MYEKIILLYRNHIIISLAWTVSFIFLVFIFIKDKIYKIKIINNSEAVQLINKKHGIVIDIRSHTEFQKGHIPGSINVEFNYDRKNITFNIKQFKKQPIIIICTNGYLSYKFAMVLYKAKFKKVFVISNGINGWNEDYLPLISK